MSDDTIGTVAFHLNAKIGTTEMRNWSPARIAQFFHGVSLVVGAANGEIDASWLAVSKMPPFDPTASEDVRNRWFQTFDTMMKTGAALQRKDTP